MKLNISNARLPEQLEKMEKYKKTGICHFCRKGFEEKHNSPILFENKDWFVTANDYPYEGCSHHYLIVSQKHITEIIDIEPKKYSSLFKSIKYLKDYLKAKGYSVFVRSGDMNYTGATLDHLHFHFIVGKKKNKNSKWLSVTLGYRN